MGSDNWVNLSLEKLLLDETPGFWGEPPNGSNEVSVLRATNLTKDGGLDFSEIAIRSFPAKKIDQKRLQPGDIVLERSGGGPKQPVGRVALFPKKDGCFSVSNFMQRLRPDPSNCTSEFIYYSLWHLHASGVTALMQQATTGIRNLNYRDYLAYKLSIPPLTEQRKIATILSSVDATIEKTQAAIDQLEIVREGLHAELLTRGIPGKHIEFKRSALGSSIPASWEERTLRELVTQVREPVDVSPNDSYREIGVRSHCKGVFHKEIVPGTALGTKRVFKVEPNCIVINIVFAWEGAIAATSENDRGFIASHRFPMFRPQTGIDLHFLRYVLQSRYGVQFLKSISPGGAGRNKTLNQSSLLKCPIPVPTLDEQRTISKALTQAESTLDSQREHVVQLRKVKGSLLDALLSGRIRVAESILEVA